MAALNPVSAIRWQSLAPGLLLIAALLLLFRETATAMVGIWNRSDTFAHAFLVPPITLWMIWRRRERLAQLPRKPMGWLLLPIAATCLLWLLGELASVNAAAQLALVTLIVLSVPAVFGWAVARELTFPLLFLFFAVPIGEFMVAPMMEWTADFTVAALQFTGIPVYREGLQFVIPTGNWSVVEACSGVRYLIASFMVGTLFAYLNYTSTKRRVIFMLVSLAVPVVANWLRAYLIVIVGHLSDNRLAAGVDHIVYGWVFFGIVIGVMFMIGARWSEPDNLKAPVTPLGSTAMATAPGNASGSWAMVAAVLVLLGATHAVFAALDRSRESPALVLSMPEAAGDGWAAQPTAAAPSGLPFVPAFQNPSASASRVYLRGDGEVTAWVGYYRDTGYDRKLVSSVNNLVEPTLEATWAVVTTGGTTASTAAGPVPMRTTVLRQTAGGVGRAGAARLRVWSVYWLGGPLTTSDAEAKVRLAINRLLGRGDDGAVLILHTPVSELPEGVAAADKRLADFVRTNLPPLLATLDAARSGR